MACLIGSCLALVGNFAGAREYVVEVIVFQQSAGGEMRAPSPGNISEHRRRLESLAERSERAQEQDREREQETAEHEIFPQVDKLRPVRAGLIDSGYPVLTAISWRQPASLYQDAPLIPLHQTDQPAPVDQTEQSDPVDSVDLSDQAADHAGDGSIFGFARVYTTTLIYADLDLQFTPPLIAPPDTLSLPTDGVGEDGDAFADEAAPQPYYFITEKRRLKFEQIHYFDHPMFGAILGVWPVVEEGEGGGEK